MQITTNSAATVAAAIERECQVRHPKFLVQSWAPVVTSDEEAKTVTVYCGIRTTVEYVRNILIDMFGVEACEWNGCTQTVRL